MRRSGTHFLGTGPSWMPSSIKWSRIYDRVLINVFSLPAKQMKLLRIERYGHKRQIPI